MDNLEVDLDEVKREFYAKMFILELVGKFTPVLPRVETVCG